MDCYKKAYESEGMALTVIDELIANDVDGAKDLTTYQCDECHYWHLTSIK
jgi:hypothetical protein